jgi:hypothetical protein
MVPTVRIFSPHFPDGLVINQSAFDPAVHRRFEDGPALAAPAGGSHGDVGGARAEAVADVLSRAAADIVDAVTKYENADALVDLAAAERAGKNRTTVLKAIDARATALAASAGGSQA